MPDQRSAARHCRPVHGPAGAVAAAHPLAVSAATSVFARGGGAVDAAISAQAVICVLMPHSAGLGGDMLALVGGPDAATVAVNGAGAAAADAVDVIAGGASVTVPGLVSAWLTSHGRWGRLPLSDVLQAAIGLARRGFPLDPALTASVAAQRSRLLTGGAVDWPLLHLGVGQIWRQPELARLLQDIADRGESAFYAGPAATAVVDAVRRGGGTMSVADLARHRTAIDAPVTVPYRGGTLAVQPPSSQGVLLALAARELSVAQAAYPRALPDHLMVEITEAAFQSRSACADVAGTLDRALAVDPERAARQGGPRAYLHTAGVATADAAGGVVSSLVSVFDDFGAALFVPELGIVLNDRGAGFTDGANAFAPGKKPVHTLAPALLTSAGGTVLALATPGADGQIQTLLQVLSAADSGNLAEALAAPRWRSENTRLLVESDHPALQRLRELGHAVEPRRPGDDVFGAVVAAGIDAGTPFAAADWRRWVSSGAA